MQMTQVKELKVVAVSSGFAWALTASSRCFCSTSCTVGLSSVRSTSSSLGASARAGWAALPSFRLARFEGPGDDESRFRRGGGESGVEVRST